MQKRLCKVGGIGIPKQKMGGKVGSEKPIGDPVSFPRKSVGKIERDCERDAGG